MVEAGQTAPDFELPDQNGETVRLSGLRGQKVVVYFSPTADTQPGVRPAPYPTRCPCHHAPTTPRTIRMIPRAKAPMVATRRPRRTSQARNDAIARSVRSGAKA